MIKLPKSCVVNKFIPKKTFYEKVNISKSIKDEFSEKLSKIYWKYKLAEDTINISKTDNIEEIEIFELELKEKYNAKNLIKCITKNIPYPILFYITYENEFQYAIKYNEDIFFSAWNADLEFKFNALNIELVYSNLVKEITNIKIIDNSKIDEALIRKKEEDKILKEIEKLRRQLKTEKQFNNKVEINEKINLLNEQLKNRRSKDDKRNN